MTLAPAPTANVRIVLGGAGGREYGPFAVDEVFAGENLATLSDERLKNLAFNYIDQTGGGEYVVTRPSTGNIVISPKAVFGA